ncbi:hypothetical protein C0J52_22384 [Blattella germanica]|nr:hypothetical protein C0J52_22384 [Blattella germanica]
MQRKILGVIRRDKIPNAVMRQRAQATEIEHLATSKKWKWVGHVTRATRQQMDIQDHSVGPPHRQEDPRQTAT